MMANVDAATIEPQNSRYSRLSVVYSNQVDQLVYT